jgi:DNA-binding response OmpR family regulator
LRYAPCILVVDDDPDVQTFICGVFSEVGYDVTGVPTARRAVAAARDQSFDLIIIDLSLPDGDGLDVIRQIHSESLPPKMRRQAGLDQAPRT